MLIFMSTGRSTPPAVPWNWVIEALAYSEQVDSSTLIGLVKKAHAISDDFGKDAREMVSLRILENLFVHRNETTFHTDSGRSAKIGFDPSERCEDVLRQILHETSTLTESEKQKWDIHSFLLSKRSSLPKCPLKKLKEALLEGNHPLLASLKEKSKLIVANRFEDTSPVFNGNSVDQTTIAKDDLVSLNPGIENDQVQENQLQEANRVENCISGTTQYARREENEMSMEPPVGGLVENMLMDHDELQEVQENQLQEADRVENYFRETTELAGREESKMSIEPSVGILDKNTMTDHDENASSKKSGQSCKVAKAVDDQEELPDNNVNVLKVADREGQYKWVFVEHDRQLKDTETSIPPNASSGDPTEAKDSTEHDGQLEIGSDSDIFDDERADIATKKEAFLSSQCILSQDSMAVLTEINLCMKCNGDGQVLVCSSSACQLRVHESCLGSAATLDENGKFFCPFCLYSQAVSKYVEVKRKTSLARKDLQAFFGSGVKCRPKKSAKRECGSKEAYGNRNPGNGANKRNCVSDKDDTVLAKSVVKHDPSCTKRAAVSNAENSMPSRGCANSGRRGKNLF